MPMVYVVVVLLQDIITTFIQVESNMVFRIFGGIRNATQISNLRLFILAEYRQGERVI